MNLSKTNEKWKAHTEIESLSEGTEDIKDHMEISELKNTEMKSPWMGSPAERKRQSKESVSWEDGTTEITQPEQQRENALKKKSE